MTNEERESKLEEFDKAYGAFAQEKGLGQILTSKESTQHQVNQVYDGLRGDLMREYGVQPGEPLSAQMVEQMQQIKERAARLVAVGHVKDNLESIAGELGGRASEGLANLAYNIKPVKASEGPYAEQHNQFAALHGKLTAAHEMNEGVKTGKVDPAKYAESIAKQKTEQMVARLKGNKHTAKDEKLQKMVKELTMQIVQYGHAGRVGEQLEHAAAMELEEAFKKSKDYSKADYALTNIRYQTDAEVNADQIGNVLAVQKQIDKKKK